MKIKPELEAEYKKYVEMNDDPYSKAVVLAGENRNLPISKKPLIL